MPVQLTRWMLVGAAALSLGAAPALSQSPTTQPTTPGPPVRPPPPSDDQQTRGVPPTDAPGARGAMRPAPLPSNVPSALRTEADVLGQDFASAWNDHDAKALSSLFAQDAALAAPMHERAVGRADLERTFTRLHEGPMKASRMTTSVDSVRELSSDLVLIDMSHAVTGITPQDGQAAPPGLMRTHSIIVAQREGKELRIREMRVTPRPMGPMQPGVGGSGDAGDQLPEDDSNLENPQDYVPEAR